MQLILWTCQGYLPEEMRKSGIHMTESVETSLRALEYGLRGSLVTLRRRLCKRRTELEFDPEIHDAYR